jgi:hypothetical protein
VNEEDAALMRGPICLSTIVGTRWSHETLGRGRDLRVEDGSKVRVAYPRRRLKRRWEGKGASELAAFVTYVHTTAQHKHRYSLHEELACGLAFYHYHERLLSPP